MLLLLDAITLKTEQKFDCIYSNKVLQHLGRDELALSLQRQRDILNEDGIFLHSFWHGCGEEEHHGLRSVYYTEADLTELIAESLKGRFEILKIERYKEIEEEDSIYMLSKKL